MRKADTRLAALERIAKRFPNMPGKVVLTFEDGSRKTVEYMDAIRAILGWDEYAGPRIVSTDQPRGSVIWAIMGGGCDPLSRALLQVERDELLRTAGELDAGEVTA